ncbi:MAG: alpha-ribazole phosphatase [Armatimonadota bacterium]|nr:alpha-ribazole phosphatase [Armatimonadota bacterium]
MTSIILIRHGEVTWNRQACYTGWTDLPLTEQGVAQARRLAERLRAEPLRAVYCSDLQRASVTAEIVAAPHGLKPIIDADLRELNYGDWEGVAEVDLPAKYPELYAKWVADPARVRAPSGESFSELLERANQAISRITERYPEGSVAVVAHKSVNRTLICHWFGVDINLYKRIGQENGAINVIRMLLDRAQIDSINDSCHLRPNPPSF